MNFDVVRGKDLIGLDLLSGEQIFDRDGNLQTLEKPDPDRPRFCVVGANGWGVKEGQIQKSPSPNETSILAVLFWPSHGGKCSYFTGGDGNPEVERNAVIPFLQKGTIAKLHDDGLDFMKLDHHGSSCENLYDGHLKKTKEAKKLVLSSLPVSLFKPKAFLVTPGNLYGHPSQSNATFPTPQLRMVY